MGFILEHHQPFLRLAVDVRFHHNTARIDFLGLIEVIQLTFLTQGFHADDRNIHKGNISVFSGIEFFPVLQIFGISFGNAWRIIAFFNMHFIHGRSKGCMTAMVRPVRVNHS